MISALTIGLFIVLMVSRVPVAIAITLATMIGFTAGGYDLLSIPQVMAAATKSYVLLAIPFFVMAAQLMNAFGITDRIFGFAVALAGWIRGGLAQVNVLASMIFSGISGTAVADAAGLATIEIRAMTDEGYAREFAAAVSLASATLGPIIPPSVLMLVYAIIANVSPAEMFLAGLFPGVLIGFALMFTVYLRVRSGWQDCPPPIPFRLSNLTSTTKDGVLSLITPGIILWGMVSGVVTPTEAGVLAIGYAVFLGFLYRSVTLKGIREALFSTVSTSSLILYITAASSAMSWLLVSEGTANDIAESLHTLTDKPWVFLLIVNLALLIFGAVLETLPAMLIAVPVLLPAVDALGIDRVHFGVMVILNLLVGFMLPPAGMGLYVIVTVSGVKFVNLVRASVPYTLTLVVALFIVAYVPWLTLVLPEWLMRQ